MSGKRIEHHQFITYKGIHFCSLDYLCKEHNRFLYNTAIFRFYKNFFKKYFFLKMLLVFRIDMGLTHNIS